MAFQGKQKMTVKYGAESKIRALPGTSFQQQIRKRKELVTQVYMKAKCQWIIHRKLLLTFRFVYFFLNTGITTS